MRTGFKKNCSSRNKSFPHPPVFTFICILFYSLISVSRVPAQSTDVIFDQIFLDQGLSQSIVKCICQDKKGFMFFGTEDGLNKFDGYEFTVIKHNPRNSNSLSYNDITALLAAEDGSIWVGTFNAGLNRYDQSNETVVRMRHNPQNNKTISHDNITCIIEDKTGTLWVGTENGLNMLSKLDGGKSRYSITRFISDPENPGSLSNNHILSLLEDKSGTIWAGTADGLNKMVRGSGLQKPVSFVRYKSSNKNHTGPSGKAVRAIFQDSRGKLWIGTEKGLNTADFTEGGPEYFAKYESAKKEFRRLNWDVYAISEDLQGKIWVGTNGDGIYLIDPETFSCEHYKNDTQNPGSLSYNEIRSIFRDESGIMWVGTYGGGIDKVTRGAGQFVHYFQRSDEHNSISNSIIWCLYEDKNSILWIGTHGGGLNRLDRKTGKYSYYVHRPGNPASLSNNTVRNIIEDGEGYLWIGTNGGGLNRFDRKTGIFKSYTHDPNNNASIARNEIRALFINKSGTLWIGTYGSGLDKFDSRTGKFIHYRNDPENPNSISSDFVRVIYEDRSGTLWIGTEGGGLNRFDEKSETFTAYNSDHSKDNTLSNDYIFAIHEDKNGILWLGTFGGGLNKFDRGTGIFKYYTTESGLPSDAIYGILEDDGGNLWMSTNNGLSEFNPATGKFRNFNQSDGLQGNEFNGGSYFKSSSGEMFFGGINGFNSFFPSNVEANKYVPPVVITSFEKFNKEVKLNKPLAEVKEIMLSHNDYVFSFEFAALDYTAPEKNKYMYKMEGLDRDWIVTTASKRYANYTTLPPGTYVFRVKGSNSDGIWNEQGAMIKIIIEPPYYRTWWFTLLAAVFLAGIFYVSYKRRLKNVRMKAELKTAHDAQMSIMPQSDPDVEGVDVSGTCIPANEVGGDFFDHFWLTGIESKLCIMIGDVSGKAMKAAMTAVMTSGMILTEANEAESTSTILKRVNSPIFDKTNKQMFVAVCLATLNPATREFTFTNAGLNNPLLKSAGSIDYVKSNGVRFPLGVMKEVDYTEKRILLKPGDLLIMMTDGILEARNKNRDLYGEERLLELILNSDTSNKTAAEIKSLIINDVEKFSGRQPQHDDMTVLVIKID